MSVLRRAYTRLHSRYRRFLSRFRESRLVILERRGRFYASYQGRRFILFWREGDRSEEFKEFTALLLAIADKYAVIQAMRGRALSRQVAKRTVRKIVEATTKGLPRVGGRRS